VDTNVLLDVLHADRTFGPRSAEALRRALELGGIVACDIVWAETTAAVGSSTVGETLDGLGVSFAPIDRAMAITAGAAWGTYRARGGRRSRIVSDFIIGAHASLQADRLLTRDRGFFRAYFKALNVVEP
jgi:predicted nucleic acid-binding protein